MTSSYDESRLVGMAQLRITASLFYAGFFFSSMFPLLAQDQCLVRSITVTVTADDGKPIDNLGATDFRASLRGNSIDVVRADYERNPRRLVVMLDVSPSVTGGLGDWTPVLAAARDMVASLPSHVSVAAMIFATGTQVVGGFDESRTAILAKMGSLETVNRQTVKAVGKGTALIDAVARGLSLLEPTRPGDAMFLFTDGGENASMEKEPQLQRRILESGVRVFGIISFAKIFVSLLPQPLSEREKQQVPDVIAITGGDFIAFRWEVRGVYGDIMRNAVRAELRRLIMDMSESYRVDISLKQPILGFPKWKLSVKGSVGNKHLTLLYPQKLAPCN